MNMCNNNIEENEKKDNTKKAIESTVVKLLRTQEYTLNAVNNYGENLLHVSAAYGCCDIIKEILKKKKNCKIIDRKTTFGWTPLMQAIRNRNIDAVKLLLEEKSNVNNSTYLGMSVLGIASAINKEMLQLIYQICPSTLKNAENDDINPLCVAALKNDKDLFFSLIDMGLDVSKANDYTHIMMKLSTVPEISNLAKHYSEIEDYWNDEPDDIERETESSNEEYDNIYISEYKNNSPDILKSLNDFNNNNNTLKNIPPIYIETSDTNNTNNQFNLTENVENLDKEKQVERNFDYLSVNTSEDEPSLISPTFLEISNKEFPTSPNIYFVKNCNTNLATINENDEDEIERKCNKLIESYKFNNDSSYSSNVILKRLQSVRPADLDLTSIQNDHDNTLEIIPDYSPMSSPNVPAYINEENVSLGDKTPTPPRYKTPPKGMILNSQQTKMIIFLKRYGLRHHISTFLKEEIDMDLMLTLNNYDLQEIGIKEATERKAILRAIKIYQSIEM